MGWDEEALVNPAAVGSRMPRLLLAACSVLAGCCSAPASSAVGELDVQPSAADCPAATASAGSVWDLRDGAAALDADGKRGSAAGCLLLAVNRFGSEPVAHFDLGRQYQERGALEPAAASYEQAPQLDPAFSHAANNLGALCKQLGRYQRGEQVLRAAITVDGQFAGLEYNLGMLLVKARSEERAVAHLQNALRKAVPPEPPPRWHDDLAAVLEAVHRVPEALEHSASAVALDPTNANFVARLARLRAGGAGGGGLRAELAVAAELEAAGQAGAAYAAYEALAKQRPDDDDVLSRLA